MKHLTATLVLIFAPIAMAAPGGGSEEQRRHYCNAHPWSPWWHDCSIGNANCNATTPADDVHCPAGAEEGNGECVEGFGVNHCTEAQAQTIGIPRQYCRIGHQDCDDGSRLIWPVNTNNGESVRADQSSIRVYQDVGGVPFPAGSTSCQEFNE